MQELIERLEKATGWDRALDIEIARACPADDWRIEDDGSVSAFDGEGWYSMPTEVPAYTNSIDAALTLLPKGAEFGLSTLYGLANVEFPLNGDDLFSARREDGNLPLAICEAALRARAAELRK